MCELQRGAIWEVDEPNLMGYILTDREEMVPFPLMGYRSLRLSRRGLVFVDNPPLATPNHRFWEQLELARGKRVVFQRQRVPGNNSRTPDTYQAFPWVLEEVYLRHVEKAKTRGIPNLIEPLAA